MRRFETGATRDLEDGKLDYEGFFSPLVLHRRAEYMHKHRVQSDGELRSSDNWQKGIPFDAYMKSAFRHFVEWWTLHRAGSREEIQEAIAALMFNAEGYLHELLLASPALVAPPVDADARWHDEQEPELEYAASGVQHPRIREDTTGDERENEE